MDKPMAKRAVIRLAETGSTNEAAKELAENGAAEGTVVVAGCQTAGRGRRGGRWQSEPGVGLYMSVIARPKGGPGGAALLPVVASVAVSDGLERVTGAPVPIKWPNDVILDGKKVCGILVETSFTAAWKGGIGTIDYAVVGIGVNVNHESFPEEIRGAATSLRLARGRPFNTEQVFDAVLQAFDDWYAAPRAETMAVYRERCVNIGRRVVVTGEGGSFSGKAAGVTDDGEMVVLTDGGGRVAVRSGEVSVRGVMGYV